jgi:chromatin-remodeling ATPase INO80
MAHSGDPSSAVQSSRPSSQEAMRMKLIPTTNALTPPEQKPVRANDPMSFASILSEPATRVVPSQDKMLLASRPFQIPASDSNFDRPETVKMENQQDMPPAPPAAHVSPKPMLNGHEVSVTEPACKSAVKPRKALTAKEHENISRAMEAIESQTLSDVEESDFTVEKELYVQKTKKRAWEVEELENTKRKVCGL